ncbi:MAG: hypothetical protein GX893_03260 [Firmicutes bacterium]|nr:hypothetical protein [Bacillota bacterium]
MSEDIYLNEELKPSEVELVFHASTSKKNLSGVRGRASRTGRKGTVMTPVDFLTGKAKREYMKNSEVKVYNMYEDKVLPYEEFKELPIEKQVVLMTKWREEMTTNNIIRDMKISRSKFYNEVLKTLGIETKPRGRRVKKKENEEKAEIREEVAVEIVPEISSKAFVNEKENSSFYLAFNGIFDGHLLANRLARLARVLDASSKYEIKFEMREQVN